MTLLERRPVRKAEVVRAPRTVDQLKADFVQDGRLDARASQLAGAVRQVRALSEGVVEDPAMFDAQMEGALFDATRTQNEARKRMGEAALELQTHGVTNIKDGKTDYDIAYYGQVFGPKPEGSR